MTVETSELLILYVDDNDQDIENFQRKVNKFNISRDAYSVRLELVCCNTTEQAITYFESGIEYNVIICDYNMPRKTGLELMVYYFKPQLHPQTCFVLYTGAGNLTSAIRESCTGNGILYFEKSESFSTLISQLIDKSFWSEGAELMEKLSPPEQLFVSIAKKLISSLKNIQRHDPDYELYIGEKILTPGQMIEELRHRTKVGFEYIDSYIKGLEFFNQKP